MAGTFYALMMVVGGLGTFARRGLVVAGDAVATAVNIQAHQSAYLLAFGGDILVVATYVVVVALFYRLFKPVDRNVALVALLFGALGCAIQGFATSFQLAPLVLLGRAKFLGVFTVAQLQAVSYLFLRLYSQGYGVALICFAFFGLCTGYLIYRSTFLPRALGVLMMVAGTVWLSFFWPPFATKYFAFIMPAALAELALTLWLIVKGVDSGKWRQQAADSAIILRQQE